jgi:hypothetical protein
MRYGKPEHDLILPLSGGRRLKGLDCEYRRVGHFTAAFKPRDYDSLEREAAFLEHRFAHTDAVRRWIHRSRPHGTGGSPVPRRSHLALPTCVISSSTYRLASIDVSNILRPSSSPYCLTSTSGPCLRPTIIMPPFRVDAPQPRLWASRTATEAPRSASTRAAETPVNPAPTTTTSVREGNSAGGGSKALAVARQYDCASSSILKTFPWHSTLSRSRRLVPLIGNDPVEHIHAKRRRCTQREN